MYDGLVKNNHLLVLMPLVLAASMLLTSPTIFPVHGQFTGLVCVTASTTATACSSNPPSLGPFVVGSTFTVGVLVQNSAPLVGWDMYLATNPSFLNPTSAALGNLVTNPSLTSICVNGVATSGSCTQGTANGKGVVEVTTIDSSGQSDCNNPPSGPCSGLAFTITYKVLSATSSTSLFYPTASGCSPSSVSSPPNVCVLITDNFGTPLPENIQGATVTTTGSATPDFSLAAASTSMSVQSGGSRSDTLTVTGSGSFTGSVGLSNSTPPSGVIVTFSPNPVMMTAPGGSASSSMTVSVSSSVGPGTSFTLNVTGTSGSLSHSVSIAVSVTPSPLTGLVCATSSSSPTSCPASPPVLGPYTVGSTFTVGFFIQDSQPMVGWDAYVAVNYSWLHPVSASLGPLIAHPSLTSICVNGVATLGQCTAGTVNGPGVVEVTTIESTGNNECDNVSPCSGLAFTITYNIVGGTSGTGISYPSSASCGPTSVAETHTCLLITDSVGNPLPENIQGATITTIPDSLGGQLIPSSLPQISFLLAGLSIALSAVAVKFYTRSRRVS